jgi:heptosyltransferase III
MSQRKCAVLSARGLGDGLVALMLSHLLHLNGWKTVTYHCNQLSSLQNWFPHLPIMAPPSLDEASSLLSANEKIFLSFDGNSDVMLRIIQEGKKRCPEKIYVMNPSPSNKKGDPSSYDDLGFDPSLNMVENIQLFCLNKLGLEKTTKNLGIIPPPDLLIREEKMRVLLHPTSGRLGRSWPAEKFVKLALHLQQRLYNPVFVMNEREVSSWPGLVDQGIPVHLFTDLSDLASFVARSGYLIGNDSGVGHLASALGIPTVTICRHYRIAKIWRPGWGLNEVVFPFRWIPNIHGLRLRDRNWKKFISVKKVLRSFEKILKKEKRLSS